MFKPIMMKEVDLILGDPSTGPNFKCQARSVTLKPSASIQKMKTLCPTGRYADVDDPEWDLEIGYAYGYDDGQATVAQLLADFLLANHGTKIDFLFRPKTGQNGYTGEVTIVAGPIGGSQGAWMEGTVTLPVDGQPVLVNASGVAITTTTTTTTTTV